MEHRFTYGNVAFEYSLLLEARKTIAATVFPTRALLVKAPLDATTERVDEFLRRKFRWVLKQQRYFAQFRPAAGRQYVSGETFRYRGRSYKLLVRKIRAAETERVALQFGKLNVLTHRRMDRDHVKSLVDEWYYERACKAFADRLAACLTLFEYGEAPALIVRPLSKRWGSYSGKTHRITLNLDLIKAARRHIDYVIIHELCHVRHRQHNRDFFQLLASKLAHWEILKTELELSLLG